jgi:predicted MPP superfamily phosphohydrolase
MVYSSFLLTGAAACFSSKRTEIVRADLFLKELPKEADGLKIGVMSDFHAGAFNNEQSILNSIATINAEKPDLVALLGDYIDAHNNVKKRAYVFDALKELKPPLGIYAVLGNHDHWIDAEYVQEKLQELPAVVLNNEGLTLDNGIGVAGVDDLLESHADPLKATRDLSKKSTKILLSHNPDVNLQLRGEERVSLVISGHTHGGQIRIPFSNWAPWVPCSGKKYKGPSGLIREKRGHWTFITKGIGTAVLPIRLACPADIGIVYLRRV